MPEISIDREFLKQLLERYFLLTAESDARVSVLNAVRDNNLAAAQKFVTALLNETERQRGKSRDHQEYLNRALDAQDDDSFRLSLYTLFPRR